MHNDMAKKRASQAESETKPSAPDDRDEDRAATSGPSAVVRVRGRVFRPAWLFLLAMIASAVFVGPRLAERLPDLTSRKEYRLRVENLHFTERPHWVPHDLIGQVAKLENWNAQPISLLEESCCQEIAEAFSRHPWMKKVERVRLRPGGRVDLEITFRKPVAMVQAGRGQFYPIDADAILLPPSDFSRADIKRYPLIENPSTLPQGPAGTYWGDLMVLGAARLAEHLLHPFDETTTHWEHLKLARIELPRRTTAEVDIKDVQYRLITKDGSRILWGRAPGTDHPGELTAEQKIGRLTQYLADFGTFRPAHGPLEIDIRHWQEITQRRLSSLETAPKH